MRYLPAMFTVALISQGASACSKPQAAPEASSVPSAVSSEVAAPEVSVPAASHVAPPDLRLDGLSKDLACAGAKGKHACRVVQEFSEAGRWLGQTPSGRGRWVGNLYTVDHRVEQHSFIILAAETVPTSQVGASDLPLRVGWGPLPEEYHAHGVKLVTLVSQGDPVSRKNQALPFVRSFTPANFRGAEVTQGASSRLISEDTVYLRLKAPSKVLLVSPRRGAAGDPGDGLYAELWLADW